MEKLSTTDYTQNRQEDTKLTSSCDSQTPQTKNGTLKIIWKGTWMLFDAKIHLSINGIPIGIYSFKKGFQTEVPIEKEYMFIEIKCSFRHYKHTAIVDPKQNYTCTLDYDRAFGNFSFFVINV